MPEQASLLTSYFQRRPITPGPSNGETRGQTMPNAVTKLAIAALRRPTAGYLRTPTAN